jgi:DNA-binding transcriptional regulator GbsR (MarR family)
VPDATKGGSVAAASAASNAAVDPAAPAPEGPHLMDTEAEPNTGLQQLSPFETEAVALFVSGATAFSLPKSIGAIYGLLFASPEPIGFEECMERLGISKGSTSNGLRFLQRVGAIKPIHGVGNRRTVYTAETSLRRLVIGLLNDIVVPHLKVSGEQLGRMREELKISNGELSPADRKVLEERLKLLDAWSRKGRMLLPVLERFLAAPLK